MRITKTTIVLVCLSAVYNLQAQFQKGDWLLEGGFETHLEGSFGKKDIDLSVGGFAYDDEDSYGLSIAGGKFFWSKKELGLIFEENWYRRKGEAYIFTPTQSVITLDKTYSVSQSIGMYFRQYFDFGKGWFGGYQTMVNGGRNWLTQYQFNNGMEEEVFGYSITNFRLQCNLFISKMIGKHFGGRISFGDISYTVGMKTYEEGIWYTNFDLNFQNLITPNISIFWTFHGKSKKDRD